jgi:hypothetical protein
MDCWIEGMAKRRRLLKGSNSKIQFFGGRAPSRRKGAFFGKKQNAAVAVKSACRKSNEQRARVVSRSPISLTGWRLLFRPVGSLNSAKFAKRIDL